MIKLIVITGGVQKGPKDASAFAFPTLNSWKTTKKCIFKKINDGAAPLPLNPPLRPKQAFLESLYLLNLLSYLTHPSERFPGFK